ncbi:hypothetical protein [Leptolyngbya sp. FACHB-16]|nr:hypothetical protein [Leptolyngbya sp. FACHB-16]
MPSVATICFGNSAVEYQEIEWEYKFKLIQVFPDLSHAYSINNSN